MAGYGTDDGFEAWRVAQGLPDLPVDAPSPAALRQQASDYVDGAYNGVDGADAGYRWKGEVADFTQERAWPRTGVVVGAQAVPSDVVPDAIVRASYAAAYRGGAVPGSLSTTGSTAKLVKRQKAEGFEREFFGPADGEDLATSLTPVMTDVFGLVKPFLTQVVPGAGIGIWAVGPGSL